jgi:hypothetical protein
VIEILKSRSTEGKAGKDEICDLNFEAKGK